MFLSRETHRLMVQSVGRVMRLADGKKYGYIIRLVVVPSDVKPEVALQDNERFKVVWINALRAHDDRFNATVNKIDLNKRKPGNILWTTLRESSFDENGNIVNEAASNYGDFGETTRTSRSYRVRSMPVVRRWVIEGIGSSGRRVSVDR